MVPDDAAIGEKDDKTEPARQKLDDLGAARDAIVSRLKAGKCHRNIIAFLEIAEALGPKGVLVQAMQARLNKVDAVLERIAQITGWPRVELQSGYSPAIGGRTLLPVCGESGRWRAQSAPQIAVARCRMEPLVILDKVDDLDAENRKALKEVLDAINATKAAPAWLICGTGIERDEFDPDRFYQVNNGVIQ